MSSYLKGFLNLLMLKEKLFISYVNEFRYDSKSFCSKYNLETTCFPDIHTPKLIENNFLKNASSFQTRTLLECGDISHDTCPKYCYRFDNDCSFEKRLSYYTKNSGLHEPSEILIKGSKKPLGFLKNFLLSEPHCDIIADPTYKYIGCSYKDHLFVCDLAK